MDKHRTLCQRPRSLARFAWAACAWASLGGTGLQAQGTVQIIASNNPDAQKTEGLTAFQLRPNTAAGQAFYVYVKNGTDEDKKLTVKLSAGKAKPERWTVLATASVAVDAGKTERVSFTPPAPKAPPTQAAPPPADKPAVPSPNGLPPGMEELKGFREQLKVEVYDGKEKPVDSKIVSVSVMKPDSYVQAVERELRVNKETGKKSLSVLLQTKKDIQETGPDGNPVTELCPVQLVLSPELIPGLVDRKTYGRRRGNLIPEADEKTRLDARDIAVQGAVAKGYATITVDGCERAIILEGDFGQGGNGPFIVSEVLKPWLRLRFKSVERPAQDFLVNVEADNPPPDAAKIEVVLGEYYMNARNEKEFRVVERATRDGPRHERVFYRLANPDGALLFKATMQYWAVPFDARETYGNYYVRAQYLDENGKPLLHTEGMDKGKPVKVRDQMGNEVAVVEQEVIFDESTPRVAFQGLPAEAVRGETKKVTAKGESRSGIDKVFFFFGKPDDAKADPKAVKKVEAQPVDEARTTWAAEVTFPNETRPVDLTAEFVNGINLSGYATGRVRLTVPAGPGAGATGGTIKGKVVKGVNDDQPARNAKVVLRDPKGEQKAETTTNDRGEFEFKDVPPGEYKATAYEESYPKRGEAGPFKLGKGETKALTLALRLAGTRG